MSEARNLTEGDVKAIVDELELRWKTKIQIEAGKGLLDLVKKGFWLLVIALALHGAGIDKALLGDVARAVTK